jgi:hypothetical protein
MEIKLEETLRQVIDTLDNLIGDTDPIGGDDSNYIGDSVSEYVDSLIDIYNYDLRKWAVDNYDYVEQAVSEGLVNTENFDFHGAIQTGQYLYHQEKIYDDIELLKEHIKETYKF